MTLEFVEGVRFAVNELLLEFPRMLRQPLDTCLYFGSFGSEPLQLAGQRSLLLSTRWISAGVNRDAVGSLNLRWSGTFSSEWMATHHIFRTLFEPGWS